MPTKQRPFFPRFRDLSNEDVQCDLHVHTRRTDGEAEVEEILRTAAARGLRTIAFTEHVRHGSEWFPEFAREVRTRARAYPSLQVLVGCETKAMDARGTLDVSEAILSGCDIVLGSVHRFPDGQGGFMDSSGLSADEFAEREFRWALGLLDAKPLDVLAHPGGMYARRFGADLPRPLLREILAQSIQSGKAVEFNTSYVQDLDAALELFGEVNPRVSIGSDVHKLSDLGNCRDLAVSRWCLS